MKNIWFGKLAALAAIVLVLVIGLGMIEAVVREVLANAERATARLVAAPHRLLSSAFMIGRYPQQRSNPCAASIDSIPATGLLVTKVVPVLKN